MPLISVNGLHQLHIFIFFLAVFHVIYSAITMMLGRLKVGMDSGLSIFVNCKGCLDQMDSLFLQIRGWKVWERDSINDPEFMNGMLVIDDNHLVFVAIEFCSLCCIYFLL